MRTKHLVALGLLACAPRPAAGQQPALPRFSGGVEVVNLNVSVSDTRGHYLTDLDKPDFSILENGVQQTLSVFRRDDVPISLSVLIDTSASMAENMTLARAAAKRLVRTLRPMDAGQVMQFNERAAVLQDFTPEVAALESAIDKTRASGDTALHTAVYVALKDLARRGRGELQRRAIVLLSDGEDTVSTVTDDQVLELARRSEISVYAISLGRPGPAVLARTDAARNVHFLTTLARDTGGQIFLASVASDLEPIYARIADELRAAYTIGYVPQDDRKDGQWRRIVVLTPTRGSVLVRHRLGYYGPRE